LDRKQLEQEFSNKRPLYERIAEEAAHTLENGLKKRQIKFHSVTKRVKEFSSFASKMERRQTEKPFEDITDAVGLRIVCLLRSDIPKIAEMIRGSFQVVAEDDKTETQPLASFGYLSVHFIVQFQDDFKGSRYDGLHKIPFEIQVRTAAMDSWATVSHYLDYKTEVDVPLALRKDFQALSALFYLADTHFEMFYQARQKSKDVAARLFDEAPTEAAARLLDFDSLRSLLDRRYPDRSPGDAEAVSDLLIEILRGGYKTVADLDSILDRAEPAFSKYEVHRKKRFARVAAARVSLYIADRDLREREVQFPEVQEKYKPYEEFVKSN
jgi:putative GTP pyrophosphokinase